MAQTPDPKLIDSMAMRYRHDFWLLDEPQKESIRTTMKQLWEEVVGFGFYKPRKAQQTAVEWFAKQSEKILIDLAKNNNTFQLELCLHGLNELEVQAKQKEKEQKIEFADRYADDVMAGCLLRAEQYYNETYGK